MKTPRRLTPPGAMTELNQEFDVANRTCSVPDCDNEQAARSLCSKHYERLRRTGSLTLTTPVERFWRHVEKTETCWLWTGAKSGNGYGVVNFRGRMDMAHRVAFELTIGPIPPDMWIDHCCHVLACVNPDHIRLATPKQNAENLAGARPGALSGIRGVRWVRRRNCWQVQVGHCGAVVYGGQFMDLAEAEAAAIALRNSLFTHNDGDRSNEAG